MRATESVIFRRMKLRKGFRQLVDEAKARITTIGLPEARQRLGRDDVVFVDLRDIRELEREGMIPGAFHCPRGMLEFWIDPDSPYHKDIFSSGKQFVFYCNGAWRSALATDVAKQMGLEPVVEMDGGFTAWKDAGYPVADRAKKTPA
jgi:rhodanese-related sulfurtransferase